MQTWELSCELSISDTLKYVRAGCLLGCLGFYLFEEVILLIERTRHSLGTLLAPSQCHGDSHGIVEAAASS